MKRYQMMEESNITQAEVSAALCVWEILLDATDLRTSLSEGTEAEIAFRTGVRACWDGTGAYEMRDEALKLGIWIEEIYKLINHDVVEEHYTAFDFDFVPAALLLVDWTRSNPMKPDDYSWTNKPEPGEAANILTAQALKP